jgi:hypothetical protein
VPIGGGVPIEPSTDALTTVENAKPHLGRSNVSVPNDEDRIQQLINSYSRAIRLYTGRQFLPTEDAASKRYRYEGNGFLSLAPFELRSVTSVTLYTDLPQSSWVVLAAQSATVESQFRLEPRNGTPEGTYVWMTLPEIGMFSPLVPEPIVTRRGRGSEVTIAGNWGAGAVPADVELACIIAVANGYRNPEGFATRSMGPLAFSENMEPVVLSDEAGQSLPRAARALLGPYRRLAYA